MQIVLVFSILLHIFNAGVRIFNIQRLRQYANDMRGPQSWCTYMWHDFKPFDIQAAQNNWYVRKEKLFNLNF